MSTEAVGSWFPSGYHGHNRSKPRTDNFLEEFRHKARPGPPANFTNKLHHIDNNPFTDHDNRNSYCSDITYFATGLGKRKVQSRAVSRYQPDFIYWMPHIQMSQSKGKSETNGTYTSSYRMSFSKPPFGGYRKSAIVSNLKPLAATPREDEQDSLTTIYTKSYTGRARPKTTMYTKLPCVSNTNTTDNKPEVTEREEALPPPQLAETAAKAPRSKSAPLMTVADCLVWPCLFKDMKKSPVVRLDPILCE